MKLEDIQRQVKAAVGQLPNGMARRRYRAAVAFPHHLVSEVMLTGLEAAGLSHACTDSGELVIEGLPPKVGEYRFTLSYKAEGSAEPSQLAMKFTVVPNPRDLWQDIPSKADAVFAKADWQADYLDVAEEGKRRMVGASLRGRSHAHRGDFRDDDFRLWRSEASGWNLLVVADGAGSARFSRQGSLVACETVVNDCQPLLDDSATLDQAITAFAADRDNPELRQALTSHIQELLVKSAIHAHKRIEEVAAATEGSKLKDFATTLLVAAAKKLPCGWFVATFWIGDGAIALLDIPSGTVKLMGQPDEGEFAGQTRFLTMKEVLRDPQMVARRLRMTLVPDFTALVLMTDGVSDPMFETDANLGDFARWEAFYRQLQRGYPDDGIPGVNLQADNGADTTDGLLHWLQFWSPGNHDDRTLAILY